MLVLLADDSDSNEASGLGFDSRYFLKSLCMHVSMYMPSFI